MKATAKKWNALLEDVAAHHGIPCNLWEARIDDRPVKHTAEFHSLARHFQSDAIVAHTYPTKTGENPSTI